MSGHRILITGIGGNVGQGVLKALRASRHSFHIVGIDMEPLSAGFSLVDAYYEVPRASAPGFPDALRAIAQKEKLDAIYVCSPTELEVFSLNKNHFERVTGASVFVNPIEVIRIGADKLKTTEFLRAAGFPFPQTAAATDTEGVSRLIESHGFPLIAKPRTGFSSRDIFLVNSEREIEAAATLVPDLIVQRYLPDDEHEYTAATLSGNDNKVRALIVFRRQLLQGTTYRTELFEDANVNREITRIVEVLGAIGPCNVQFRMVNGVIYVFEINPRFSGTSGIRYLYGFNDCEMIFDLLRLGLKVEQPLLRKTVVLRYWNEVCIPNAEFEDLRRHRMKHSGFETTMQHALI